MFSTRSLKSFCELLFEINLKTKLGDSSAGFARTIHFKYKLFNPKFRPAFM